MIYRIEYTNGLATKKSARNISIKPKPILISAAIVAVAALLLWPDGRMLIRDLLLPGDEAATAAALTGLVNDLKDGQSIGTAVEVFCREIIADA